MKTPVGWMLAAALCAVASCGGGSKTAATPAAGEAASEPASSEARTGPWLWEVRKGDAVSYIFGEPPGGVMAAEVPPLVWEHLSRSQQLYVSGKPPPAKVRAAALMPDGKSLASYLSADEMAVVERELAGTVAPEVLPRLRVTLIAQLLTAREEVDEGNVAAIMNLRHRTNQRNVVVTNVSEELLPLLSDDERWATRLRQRIANLAAERASHQQDEVRYRAGELSAMRDDANRYADSDPFVAIDRLEIDLWMKLLVPAFEAGGAFVPLEAADVVMKGGYLDQLAAQGFTVRRIGMGTPVVVERRPLPRPTRAQCIAAIEHVIEAQARFTPGATDMVRKQLYNEDGIEACLEQRLEALGCMVTARSLDDFLPCFE